MEQTEFFKLLADETRLNIIMLLACKGELCVCELTESLELSQPKISRHLALLRSSGVLSDQRKGQWVYYSIHPALPTWCTQILDVMRHQERFKNLDLNSPKGTTTLCETL
ncbi:MULTISPECIES: metalloregulator ArsR/SmtB family transcription factor [unclassified Acinetobacter]|uniref:metalloregulator ArsR/SmtB family transcription factor n=1 Tax=unclassified Acinetobacter TaxID=196816 RepID=UPI0015D240C8|nr:MULTISPECIES: metalloregulator ArsR/SmtB family transcription factor [unclassified Acinetobacter]